MEVPQTLGEPVMPDDEISDDTCGFKAVSSPNQTVTGTAKELAIRLGLIVDGTSEAEQTKGYVHATALIRLLDAMGLAEKVEAKAVEGKKGKGATSWKLPSQVLIQL
jgi:hypothetical protein